jgi:hypothetical protein
MYGMAPDQPGRPPWSLPTVPPRHGSPKARGAPSTGPGAALRSVRHHRTRSGSRHPSDTDLPGAPAGAPAAEAHRRAYDKEPMIAGEVPPRARRSARAAGCRPGARAAVSRAITRGEPADALAGDAPATGVARLLAGWSLIAAGAGAWARRPGSRFEPLLVAAGLAWFLAEWDRPGAGVAPAFTASCAPRERHANPAHQIAVRTVAGIRRPGQLRYQCRSGSTLCYRRERRQVPERSLTHVERPRSRAVWWVCQVTPQCNSSRSR